MSVLVSCRHCKRAVLIAARVTEREIDALSAHLAACEPPVRVVGGDGAGMSASCATSGWRRSSASGDRTGRSEVAAGTYDDTTVARA